MTSPFGKPIADCGVLCIPAALSGSDDETAIAVVGGTVEVVPEAWRRFDYEAPSRANSASSRAPSSRAHSRVSATPS